jgi:hypothetical protein
VALEGVHPAAYPNLSRVKKLLIPFFLGAAVAVPAAAQAAPTELGSAADAPASCPDDCQAVGRVTGYQLRAGTTRSPFRVRRRGKIVAFTIALGNPRRDQIEFFDNLFGGPSQVQLVVLRPGTRRRHRLTGRSQVVEVNDYFGSTPTFALERPLTVRKDYIVAITVPTWIPSFAVNQPESDVWRSSRDPDRCDDVRQHSEQTRRGSLRTYGCIYRTARLLYSATFVPDPRRTNAG